MSSYLVTGGAGFIGSHLATELVNQGHTVRILDNFSTGQRRNLAHLAGPLEVIQGDIRDPATCQQAVAGVEAIFHHAAIPSVQFSIEEPLTVHAVGVTGSLNLLRAAVDAGVKRVVCASSSAIYGDSPELPKREAMLPQPKSPYAAAKLSVENYCQAFYQAYGLQTVNLRYFNVFGPRQDPGSPYSAVIPIFIKKMLAGQPPVIYGDGLQSRDFVHISNVVQANLLAATSPQAAGGVFNVAVGQQYNLLELVERLNAILGTAFEPLFAPARAGEAKYSVAEICRAEQQLGYAVKVDFAAGLEQTAAWYRSQPE